MDDTEAGKSRFAITSSPENQQQMTAAERFFEKGTQA